MNLNKKKTNEKEKNKPKTVVSHAPQDKVKRSKPKPALTPFKAYCADFPKQNADDLFKEWKKFDEEKKKVLI